MKFGHWDFKKASQNFSSQDCTRYGLQITEKIEDICRKTYLKSLENPEINPVYDFTGIFDFENFSILQQFTSPKSKTYIFIFIKSYFLF